MATVSKNFKVKNGLEAGSTIFSAASTTAAASLNIPHGTAPTSPANGDFWTTSSGAYVRINGVTVGPLASSAGSGTPWGTITGTLSSQTDLQSALDAKLNLSGGTLTGNVTISKSDAGMYVTSTANDSLLAISSVANKYALISLRTSSSDRWLIMKSNYGEPGSNVGSDLLVRAYSDAGSFLSTPLTITRSTGAVSLGYTLSVASTSTFNNDVTINKASSDLTLRLNPTSGYSIISLDRASGQWGYIQARTGTSKRWIFGVNGDSESGANAGSNFFMYTYDDAGSYLASPLFINRANNLFTLAGDVSISKASAYLRVAGTTGTQGRIVIDTAASGTDAYLQLRTGVNARWGIYKDSTAESGSNAGSDFKLYAFNDAGSSLGAVLSIVRSTGLTTLTGDLTISKASPSLLLSATSGSPSVNISGVAGTYRGLQFKTAGVRRWTMYANADAESGSDVGSDFALYRANDAGSETRVMYIQRSTGNVTFDSATTLTGNLTISKATATLDLTSTSTDAYMRISRLAGNGGYFEVHTNGARRWVLGADTAAESGSNAGSNFALYSYSDAGSFISTVLHIYRSTGDITLASTTEATSSTTGSLKVAGGLGITKSIFAGGTITAGPTHSISAGTDGFKNATYSSNVRNPIWRFGNSDGYGFSYFQGSSGIGGNDTIGFHFGTATSAASLLQINSGSNGNITVTSVQDSSSTSTGSIITTGGMGVAKKLYVGTTLNVGTSVTIGTETAATREYVNSKVMNLVTNGTGLLGNNYNFPGLTYDQTQVFSGLGSFKWTGNYTNTGITEYIPVDTGKTYRFQYAIKQTGSAVGATFYGMVVCYDADGLGITSQNHMFQAGTNTTLAADLVPGATTVQLTSAANWNNAATYGYQRTITVWGYTNAKGYTYPDYTYTRRYVSDAYANGGISGNTITLSAPWPATWGTIPAGTAVSNGTAGGTYKYVAGLNNVATTTWTTYTGEIGGVDLTGTNAYYGFSPGTAYIQLGWLLNYNSTANSVLNLSAISFSEVSSGQLRSMTKYDSTLSGVDWFTVKSAGATPALSVDVTNYRVGIGKTAPTVPLDVSGAAAISGTLSVTGATTLSDALNLSGSQHTIKNATPSTLNFAKGSQFGYSSGYRTIVLGDTGTSNKTSLAFGVDVVDIADGATWGGDGREVIFRNAQEFMTPNSGRTAFIKPMKWDSSGNTTMLGLTASSATINGSITQTSGAIASVNNSTAKLRLGRLNSANAPTTISTDNYYIELGSAEYNTNSYRLMGFGYRAASHMPAYLGYQEKDISGFTKGDLIFGTRDVTTDTEPTERMRIAASGLSTFAGDVTLSKASPVLGLSASSGTPSLNIDSPAAAYDTYLNFRTGTSARWSWSKGGTESGTNAGSNLYLYAYSDAGALLSTPLTITRSTGAVALTGDLTVGPNKTLSLDASAGSATSLKFTTSGANRWLLQKTNTAESGANAGSDLVLYARDDSGNAIGTALSITRSTMAATFGGSVTAASFSTTGTTTTAGIKRALVTKTAAYTLTTSDNIVVATTGTWNATLPTAVSAAGTEYIIKNSGTGTITVDTTSSQTIDGSLTVALAQYDSLTVVSDGTNWVIV